MICKKMSEKKRTRGVNYSPEENAVLLHIAGDFRNIIENKRTDSVTNKQKDDAWKKIEIMFNARAPNCVHRPTDSLKKHYDNLKKKARYDFAEQKMELLKTGGGQSSETNSTTINELTLSLLNQKTVAGLQNQFDSDSQIMTEETVILNEECLTPTDEILEQIENQSSVVNTNQTNNMQTLTHSAENNKNMFHKPISTELKSNWEQRRRPVLQTSLQEAQKKYFEAKLELVKLQIEYQKEEHALKKVRDAEEHKEKMRNLDLETKLKEAQLRILQ